MFGKSKSEKSLLAAQERVKEITKAFSKRGSGVSLDEHLKASSEQAHWEREVAKEKGEEYAIPFDFPLKWDTGAPLPFVLASDYKTFLTFYIQHFDPNWDGTYVKVVDPADGGVENLALVEFKGCSSFRFGSPNDEVFNGHPLADKGQEGYSAQQVINSKWKAEMEKINSVHTRYDPDHWKELKHYIFWFHDNTFECLAKSFTVQVVRDSMQNLLSEINKRLLK